MLNGVYLEGRLVSDPIARGGGSVAAFRLAHEDSWRDETVPGGWRKQTHYIDVSCFSDVAQRVIADRKKGDTVVVEGKIEQNRYVVDGQERSQVRIQAFRVSFVRAPRRVEEELAEALNAGVEATTQANIEAATSTDEPTDAERAERIRQLEAELAEARAETGVDPFVEAAQEAIPA